MPSATKGLLRPRVQRLRLGRFEITNILDGVSQRDGPHPMFGADQPAEAVHRQLAANRLPATRFEHSYTPTVVSTGDQLVLFDTGNGAARRSAGVGDLRALLPEAGYRPEDIDVVVITHCHPDHIGGLLEGEQRAFPRARYVFGRREFDFWRGGENIPDGRGPTRELFMQVALPFADEATFLEPDEEVVPGIRSVEAFGHSPGHMAYHVESEGERLLLWADLTNHYVVSLQRPEWKVKVDDDPDQAIATRKRLLEMVAVERLWAVGYHMPFPAIGWVDKTRDGYRWVPISYQLNL
ncbi:MAG TPA: MBL fold metallo-hydrolase [Geminicoccaceae bacterium]|nr:MBL fold metallo-hydrolase [Geminicoccaceae bacterium]